MKRLFLVFCLFMPSLTSAHEGHVKAPGDIAAPHGGKILAMPEIYLEVIKSDSGVTVYALTHDLKPIATEEIKLTAKVELPKQKVKSDANVESAGDSWTVTVDAKNARRVTLFFTADWKGKKGTAKHTIER